MPDLNTAQEIRDFLRLCLNPPGRSPRTPTTLALIMPDWVRGPLHEHAPHLAALRAEAERIDEAAARAHAAHAKALAQWIEATEPEASASVGEEQEPTQLRWGLDDVMWGDDDNVTVLLSGPHGEPYWLEMDAERAAALRENLTGPDDDENLVPYNGEHGYPEGEEPTTSSDPHHDGVELTPEETGERENSLLYWLGPRTSTDD